METGDTPILIAAFSGRALAQSARRAGFVPLVADAFGDLDTLESAAHHAHLPEAVRRGFTAKALIPALDGLVAQSPEKPIGIVLGSGFEDRPRLIETLDKRYGLLGCRAELVKELKSPQTFFPLLKQLGIAHPETALTPPAETEGWLRKRIGAAGGSHIRDCAVVASPGAKHYFQRRIAGRPHSVLAVTSRGGVAMELSRQWTAPSAKRPYRYGGAVLVDYDENILAHTKMVTAAATLVEVLDPAGLVSFDFLVDGAEVSLLEVNPRPGATLDIFDDLKGNLFRAHVEAGLGHNLWQHRELPAVQSRAAALLYADRGGLIAGVIDWPDWASDRPAPGTRIRGETPIATVHAQGNGDVEAEAQVRARLSTLEDLVYTSSKTISQEN